MSEMPLHGWLCIAWAVGATFALFVLPRFLEAEEDGFVGAASVIAWPLFLFVLVGAGLRYGFAWMTRPRAPRARVHRE